MGNLTSSQYLARLAAEATTVINAPDYARMISDLAIRRDLIAAAEHCAVTAKTTAVTCRLSKLRQQPLHVWIRSSPAGLLKVPTMAEALAHDGCRVLETRIAPRQKIVGPWLPEKGLAMIYSLAGWARPCSG